MAQIQWFPGHMAKAKREIADKIKLIDIVIKPTTSSLLERTSSSPATNNAIRGAEQAGNIAKQWFC